jgi:hypothetical protein
LRRSRSQRTPPNLVGGSVIKQHGMQLAAGASPVIQASSTKELLAL